MYLCIYVVKVTNKVKRVISVEFSDVDDTFLCFSRAWRNGDGACLFTCGYRCACVYVCGLNSSRVLL